MTTATAVREIRGKYPPNIATIAKFFKIGGRALLFAYAPSIYNPKATELTPALLAHETEHIRSQLSYLGGPEQWWMRYCLDPPFRMAEEVMGHTAEMLCRLRNEAGSNVNLQALIVRQTADRLRDKLYLWTMSQKAAADLLMQHGSRIMDMQELITSRQQPAASVM